MIKYNKVLNFSITFPDEWLDCIAKRELPDDEWEVESIVEKRIVNNEIEYRIKWKVTKVEK